MPRQQRTFAPAAIEANLTPMIDVTFLLIVFFALVSRLSDSERVDMTLAQVRDGAALRADEESRVILNAIPARDGSIGGYAMGGKIFDTTPDGIALLAETLAQEYRRQPRLAVRLRADRATHYEWVEPAMRATTTAARLAGGGALPRLDFVVETDAYQAEATSDAALPKPAKLAPKARNGA